MNKEAIHIYEENINLFWGLMGLVSIAGGVYLLAGAFFGGDWRWIGAQQIISLGLFAIGFYAIVQLTRPLYHFILYFKDDNLFIEILESDETKIGTQVIALADIEEVKVLAHDPRKENEALWDFSTNFHLLYCRHDEGVFREMLRVENQTFTLKIKDIQKIVDFITHQNPRLNISNDSLATIN